MRDYQTLEGFESVLTAGFKGILMPQRKDENYLGIAIDEIPAERSPLERIAIMHQSIRALFIREEEKISILPNLIKPIHSGRMIDIQLKNCTLDMMWRSRKLRKVSIKATNDTLLSLAWPKGIKSFRIKKSPRERGSTHQTTDPLPIENGQRYYLDRFQR